MAARLGNVIYWAACILAALCLVLGWVSYQGADTTGIELARSQGEPDVQIFQQQKRSGEKFKFDEAVKAGYTQTEVLNYLVSANRSRLSGALKWPPAPEVYIAVFAAVLIWLVGRAVQYVLAAK
jgi:hypothetical protein